MFYATTVIAAALLLAGKADAQTTVTIGIGTQDTTTNTATAGVIIRQSIDLHGQSLADVV
ncbi:hypothetical protein [Tardiphaga sp. 42S5]|uniref:hypothetical protein n=1 Tax=Tardiphaga sp. 42S5 TaxID=1404799 RepID=UPI002A5AB11C|nr:hypothetical protein [Tardiphaga sp. 42S5]WPO42185.1 hypothetical protein SFY93_03170 [Tardiphaga sp. 42S5]